mmetsp:Transcript_2154/g.6415  ORF Transcript_2154/g.6415 Transcript_2154/m.6415 type:complete len:379 (+) Transcript_2154:966-2102(+)
MHRFRRSSGPFDEELISTAQRLTKRGGGVLASDESMGTIGKRLVAAGLSNDENTRRDFRELLYTGEGLGDYLNGVILFHETLYQSTRAGERFVDVLNRSGVVVGIKVDKGLRPLPRHELETYTEGLDGLGSRCKEYYEQGARFAKWRATYKIDLEKGCPSESALEVNAAGLADYASIAQDSGLVPIVEPEILIDGAHSAEVSACVAEKVVAVVYEALRRRNILLEGTLLKPMMIFQGAQSSDKTSAEEIARLTIKTMRRCVPPAVPGIMFLSGGMSEEDATKNLDAINKLAASGEPGTACPWALSFSYGRALQSSVLNTWAGKEEMREDAKRAAVALAKANAEAQMGNYKGPHPTKIKAANLIEGFRGWREGADPDRK